MVPQKRDDAVRSRFINESTFETNQFQTEINQGGPLGMFAKRPPLKAYLVALRPWSFTASLTPVCLGSCLAYKSIGIFNIWIVLATCFTALSVHAAGNLVNTYFDFKRGVDKTNAAQDRTLVDRLLPEADVVNFGQLCYLMGCAGFVTLVCISPAKMEHLAFVFFGGLSGSFLYTGGLGLKYVALGDVAIFFTFGPITVLFSFMAQGGTMCWMPIGYALPLALNIAARIVTLAILIGQSGSYFLFTFLLFTPYIAYAVLALNVSIWFLLPLSTVFIAFSDERIFRSGDLKEIPQKIARLNFLLGSLYICACALTPSEFLPGFS